MIKGMITSLVHAVLVAFLTFTVIAQSLREMSPMAPPSDGIYWIRNVSTSWLIVSANPEYEHLPIELRTLRDSAPQLGL